MSYETRNFINNEFIPGIPGKSFPIFNPYTESKICNIHEAQQEDVNIAVHAAENALSSWSTRNANERAAPLFKLAQLIRQNAEELAILDSICMGKPLELLKRMDIPACAGIFEYYAGCANHILGETSLGMKSFMNLTVRQPYGVVGLIIPWNVPMIMFAFKVAPALITGNTVILKPSEKAPLSSLKMASLIIEAGFPPGVVNIVNGDGPTTGSAIALHPKIRKISFTGSVATGRKIMRMAADSNLKNVSLELGGKSPAIIFEDADIVAAARYTHFSINHNSGQHCQANSRVLVHRKVEDAYMEELKRLASQVKLGDPMDKQTFQGPQVDGPQVKQIIDLIDHGKQDGTLVMGGEKHPGTVTNHHNRKGHFVRPTILLNVSRSSPAYQQEIFGPVVIVNTFDSEEAAIEEANGTEFGLFASVYTKDLERAIRVSHAIHSGAVGVNCSVPLRAVDMPIGGWKQSGIGRELSLHGLNMYTELKTIFLKYGSDETAMASNWHTE
ncbi:hypothetical protein FE257_001332 [Aspergillus nanangensis]|uniref:aldehyde dehydrogenase (NAD(+)) n=1 Tax=Aspergillus nanangensis TaxID=2582783 RepID=A0AAD4CF83_ASPNN|nr:hypothetical protein FE257_001332 [Aspergillus nanangensis]